jgi:uncharacterized coiled-coil DUF342 family protein
MTTRQLHAELVETTAKIRSMNEALKTVRARHTELKARLSDARAEKKAQDKPL